MLMQKVNSYTQYISVTSQIIADSHQNEHSQHSSAI